MFIFLEINGQIISKNGLKILKRSGWDPYLASKHPRGAQFFPAERHSLLVPLHTRVTHIRKKYISYARLRSNSTGDTCTFTWSLLKFLIGQKIMVRQVVFNTPEIRGKCKREKVLALKAKRRLVRFLENTEQIESRKFNRGKYFPIVAEIWNNRVNNRETPINEGVAVRYLDGRKKSGWCIGVKQFAILDSHTQLGFSHLFKQQVTLLTQTVTNHQNEIQRTSFIALKMHYVLQSH